MSLFTGTDVLFMVPAVTKHGGHWEFSGKGSRAKDQLFKRSYANA